MIRKVYLDFIGAKIAKMDVPWIGKRAIQYSLIHASFFVHRPLCGPILGTLVTNYSCNYRCRMCDLPLRDQELRGRGLRELDTAGMKGIVKDFAALGTAGIGFTGGEPLLRNDIFELLGYTRSLGMITHLNTNGFFLDAENARKIIEAKVDSLNISLDGAQPSTHDGVRGVPGAFTRVMNAVACVQDMRKKAATSLRIKAVAVIDEVNINEVPDLIRLARDLGLDSIEFIPRQPFRLPGTETARNDGPDFFAKVEALEKFLLEQQDSYLKIENSPSHIRLFKRSFARHDSPLTCYAGYNSYAVDCYGELYPCVPWINWRRAVGNIKAKGLQQFWYSSEYNEIRKDVAACRKCYLNCQAELNLLFRPFR